MEAKTWNPSTTEEYIEFKLEAFSDFGFEPTEEQIAILRNCNSENEGDRIGRKMLLEFLEK